MRGVCCLLCVLMFILCVRCVVFVLCGVVRVAFVARIARVLCLLFGGGCPVFVGRRFFILCCVVYLSSECFVLVWVSCVRCACLFLFGV